MGPTALMAILAQYKHVVISILIARATNRSCMLMGV